MMYKKNFVENIFKDALQQANPEVYKIEYSEEGGGEFVEIYFSKGFQKSVSVTGDSLNALMIDIIKAAR